MKIIEDIKSFNQNVKEKFDSRYIYAYLCFLYSLLRFGASPKDFFRYEFYKKSNYERNKFTTWLRSKKIISKLNKGNIAVYENKVLFNQLFQEYIKRKWLDLSTCTFEEFYDFLKQYQSIIIKPVDGGSGRGIQKIKFELYEKNELREYFDQHRTCIAEEVIIQHELMSKLNPNSVNTIRVLTITNKDNVEIVQCSLRTGGERV